MYAVLVLWLFIIAISLGLAVNNHKSPKIYEIDPGVSAAEQAHLQHRLMKEAQENKSFKPIGLLSIAALILMVILNCVAVWFIFQTNLSVALQLVALSTLCELGMTVAFPIAQYQHWKTNRLPNVVILAPKPFNKLMITRTLSIITRSFIFWMPVFFQTEFTALLSKLFLI